MKKKFFYSLSLNLDQAQGRLTREQYFDLIERAERGLGLRNQRRFIVFHEKRDEKGIPREHYHVVWSRAYINDEKIRAVDVKNDRLKLRAVAQEFLP